MTASLPSSSTSHSRGVESVATTKSGPRRVNVRPHGTGTEVQVQSNLTDLSKFAAEHHHAIERLVCRAADAGIIAEPFRYLPNDELSPGGTGHVLIAFRERHDTAVTPSEDRWYAVLDVDTDTVYQHDRLLQAFHDARGWKGSNG